MTSSIKPSTFCEAWPLTGNAGSATDADAHAAAAARAAVARRLKAQEPSAWLPEPRRWRLRELSLGAYHFNYELTCGNQRSIVRLSRRCQWGLSATDQLRKEYLTLCDLAASDVTPRPLALIDGEPPMLIETLIPGRPFSYGPSLKDAAQAIASTHALPAVRSRTMLATDPPSSFLVEDGLARLEAAASSIGRTPTIDRLMQFSTGLSLPSAQTAEAPVIVHTDLIASNLLVTAGGCAVVDWEGARLGPAEWDLAYFLSPVTLWWAPPQDRPTRRQRDAFLASYTAARGQDMRGIYQAVRSLLPFVVFRALAWCVGFAATTRLSPAVATRLASFTNERRVSGFLAEVSPST